MSRASSQLRVFVQFKEDTVFAGEDVECTITFKNVEVAKKKPPRPPPAPREEHTQPPSNQPLERLRTARAASQTSISRKSSISRTPQSPHAPSSFHRNTSSFSVVESATTERKIPELPSGGFHIANAPAERKHRRKVSIVSLGGSVGQQRLAAKHGRSASVQVSTNNRQSHLPRPSLGGRRSQTLTGSSQSPSPLSPSPLSASNSDAPSRDPHTSSSVPHLNTPQPRTISRAKRKSSTDLLKSNGQNNFRFPPALSQAPSAPSPEPSSDAQISLATQSPLRSRSPRSVLNERANGQPPDDESRGSFGAPFAKAFSLRSMEGSPRSSLDIYSTSNHSNETLTSEIPTQQTSRLLPNLGSRRASLAYRPPADETVLLGFAQLTGSFTLDGSLVNQAPFDETKRRAVVGGQGGGGVVGITRSAAENSLFGGLNWGSIGQSLGDFMGAGGPSSIKEMKGIAGSNTVPLLSTTKSILFVDLTLAPGESRSYSYRFTLPRGLPPSHKGRAIKVSYNLIVGTHRPGSKSDQPLVKQVDIPFRVLSGVNTQGECLGHDLMSPYIILKDQARTSSLSTSFTNLLPSTEGLVKESSTNSSADDFQSYVHRLLTRPRRDSSYGLLSPTAEPTTPIIPPTPSKSQPPVSEPPTPTSTNLIEHAIRSCTHPSSPIHSPTNFTIARASVPIASLKLSRPALKLGEILTCTIDFSGAKLPCYALEATLESSESVDPALAIRSPQSIERATKRVWAGMVENAIWARRCVFRAQVPVIATPAFTTTGVSLEWCVKLELVVGYPRSETAAEEEDSGTTWDGENKAERVLEVAHADDRGTVFAAKQHLYCDSFQVEIPLRVFGAVVGGAEDAGEQEGLAI